MSRNEIDVLARTIYGEARGEGISGQEAIASVVLNRVARAQQCGGFWWGNTIAEVCQKPWQFSCWNTRDPNLPVIKAVKDSTPAFATCKRIALRATAGLLADRTNGATHYHTKRLRPKWSIGKIPCAELGSHFFYNDIE